MAQTFDCDGHPATAATVTAGDGTFVLRALAPGATRITVQSGSFLAEATVEVPEEGAAAVGGGTGKVCFDARETKIAVLSGTYDHAERILADLGFEHTPVCGAYGDALAARRLLQDWDRLRTYRVLFINCGTGISLRVPGEDTDRTLENLRRFVREGGSVYVSDLSADFVRFGWPGLVDFALPERGSPSGFQAPACCVCGLECPEECPLPEDPFACGRVAMVGRPCRGVPTGELGTGQAGHVQARLEADFLRQALGRDEVEIGFDLGGWMRMEAVAAGVEVLVASEERPLMVMFRPEPGGGRVAYTSFHTSAQPSETIDLLIRALVLRL